MKYDAFISYRHSELDMEIAKKIHSGLESYHVPKSVQEKSGKKSIKRVFRDQEELPIGSDLDDNISGALKQSEYLIVICSPRTPESYWVCKEIETFIEMHDRQHVLAVLVEGEPDESFPPLLLEDENGNLVEPLAADVRGTTAKERNAKLKTELLRLAAPLLNCSYDDLRQRHRERKIRRMATLACLSSAIIAVLGIGFAIYNASMAAKIEKNYNQAVENYNLALKNYDIAMTNYEQSMFNQYMYMADLSDTLLKDGYREDAVLVGLEAFSDRNSDSGVPYVPQAEYALSQALYTYSNGYSMSKDGMLEHKMPVTDFKYDADKCHLLTVEQNNCVYVWDVKNREMITRIVPVGYDNSVNCVNDFEHVGNEIIIASNYGVGGYDLEGKPIWNNRLEYSDEALIDAESGLVFCQFSKKIEVYNIDTHAKKATYDLDENMGIYLNLMKFDTERNLFYVGCSKSEGDNSYVEVIDISTGDRKLATIKGNTLSALTITDEGDIVTVSSIFEDIVNSITSNYTVHIQKTNIDGMKEAWSKDIEQMSTDMLSGSKAKLKYRCYETEDGSTNKEIIFAENNQAFCFNAENGTIISKFAMPGAIKSVMVAANGSLGYFALNTGNIEIVNLSTGYIYSSEAINTDMTISDICISNGVLAVRSYVSPDVLVMKYHTGRNMEQLLNTEGAVSEFYESADGKYLATNLADTISSTKIYIGNSSTGKFSEVELTKDECDNPKAMGYSVDNRFTVIDMNGQITYIDPESLSKKTVKLDADNTLGFVTDSIKFDGKYVLGYRSDYIVLYDVENDTKVIASSEMEDELADAVASKDGTKIYILTSNGKMLCLDTATGNKEVLDESIIAQILEISNGRHIYLSNAGDKLALVTSDGMLRVIDLVNNVVTLETEFRSSGVSFVEFSKDDSVIITQADDYYIRIYCSIDGENLYTSSGQHDTVKKIFENDENNVMAIAGTAEMVVLDKTTNIPVAEVSGGRILTSDNRIISSRYKDVYVFPYQTATSLREDAKEQFGDAELSDAKKVKYHIGNDKAAVADMEQTEMAAE